MMINRRRAYGGKKQPLPYDYEVQYLEGDGSSYLDLGFSASTLYGKKFTLDFSYKTGRSTYVFGGVFPTQFVIVSGKYRNDWGRDLTASVAIDINTKYSLVQDNNTIRINGTTLSIKDAPGDRNFFLFTRNPKELSTMFIGKIYRFTVEDAGTIIMDFIPVVKDGIGCMYDKVSGTFFYNQGTGDFIVGPDKEAVTSPAIDMGLPSGTLWAQGNIIKDANGNYAIGEPTDYGCYFSWGNIDGHNAYSEDNYSFDDTNYNASPGKQLVASIPNNDVEHDAAVARLGNGWHMPTSANFQELFNSNNCTWQWTSVNGVNGYLVTSKRNGNTLFFPASGIRDGSSLNRRGQYGYYWSSSFDNATFAYNLYFSSRTVYPANFDNRRYGFTIRPVI